MKKKTCKSKDTGEPRDDRILLELFQDTWRNDIEVEIYTAPHSSGEAQNYIDTSISDRWRLRHILSNATSIDIVLFSITIIQWQ